MNNKAIHEFGFRRIKKMQISEGKTLLDLHNSSYLPKRRALSMVSSMKAKSRVT